MKKMPKKRSDIVVAGQDWRKGKLKFSADEVRDKFVEYVADCRDRERRATWEGFAGALGVPSDTLMIWLNAQSEEDKGYNEDMVWELKKVRDWLSDELQQRGDPMAIFALKQARYGGYSDRPVSGDSGPMRVNVTIKGVEDAFG